jgi:hypothetical protein
MLNKNKMIEGEIKCGAQTKKSMNIKQGTSEGLEKILSELLTRICSEMCP